MLLPGRFLPQKPYIEKGYLLHTAFLIRKQLWNFSENAMSKIHLEHCNCGANIIFYGINISDKLFPAELSHDETSRFILKLLFGHLVTKSCLTPLQPCGLKHARLPCPLLSLRVCSKLLFRKRSF